MGRRIWIVSADTKITKTVRNNAKLNGCPEIACGIPPALDGKVGALPCAYEEPESSVEPTRDLMAEIDELKAQIAELQK